MVKMANFFLNLAIVSTLYHVLTCGLICVENGGHHDGIYDGIGVSAFTSTRSSVRTQSLLSSSSAPKTKTTLTVAGASKPMRTFDSGPIPLSFTSNIYAKDPLSSRQESKPAIATRLFATKGDSSETDKDLPPSSVTGPFALLLTSQFLLFIGVGAVIPSIPLYGKEIGLSSAANGIVISAPAVALFLAANWSGRRADIARKPAMMIGMAVIAISDIGTALAQGIYTLVLARLGLGAGRALSEAGERGMLLDLANQIPKLRGRALAAQQAVVALGIAIGAPAGGLVVEQYGPRAAFLVVGAAAITAVVLYAFLPETIIRSSSSSSSNPEEDTEVLDESTSGVKVWSELLSRNEWKGLTLCQSGSSFGFAAKIASIPILATSTLPGGAVGAGALLSAAGLSGLVGAPIGGYITDRIGAKGAVIVSGLISSLGLILIPATLQIVEGNTSSGMEVTIGGVVLQTKALCFALAVLVWSLGVSAQGPALQALAQENSLPGIEATSLSLMKAAGDGTYIIAPFLLGLVADALVEYPGIECALAGSTTLLGTAALAILVQQGSSTASNAKSNSLK